jgi:hypothetical protein
MWRRKVVSSLVETSIKPASLYLPSNNHKTTLYFHPFQKVGSQKLDARSKVLSKLYYTKKAASKLYLFG